MNGRLIKVDIDQLPAGTMVLDAQGMTLGWVQIHLEMNGNYRSKERRVLNTGKPSDRFAYRRHILYIEAKASGVYVRQA